MTDKQKIRAEVERLYKENSERCSIEGISATQQLYKVLSFIDSMPEEQLAQSVTKTSDQEEPADENFDAFERKYMKDNEAEIINIFDRHAGLVDGARWQRNNVWHDAKKEKPVYDSNIAVIRHPSDDVSMSVCAMVSEDIIYSPVARKEYKWGSCPFTHWAYIEDLLPNGKEE